MAHPPLHFRIQLADPQAHRLRLQCRIAEPEPKGQVLRFASWTRGSYLVRDFARHLMWLRAESHGQPVCWQRLDKRSIRFAPCDGPLLVDYEIHAFDPSVRKAYIDSERGFINGTSVFWRAAGIEGPIGVTVEPPAMEDWQLATTMAVKDTDKRGFGDFEATDWEELVDHPFSFGPLRRVRFAADGILHELTFTGTLPRALDEARLREDLTRICEAERALFGGEPKLERYQFQTAVTADSYGGLEHRSSCALVCARDDLPLKGETERSARYRGFLGLCSHEYFHLWNVKRITPEAFADSDLGGEAYTRDLWAYEGVTSYYDDHLLLRAGCLTPQQYLDGVAETITRLTRTPGRHLQSLAESSFEAWTKFYQPDENLPNATVSYYGKGALAALALDLRLRRDSEASLDDVMRRLWADFGATGKPAPERALETAACQLSGLEDLPADFERWLRGTGELPLAELLADFGVKLKHEVDPKHPERSAHLGLRLLPQRSELSGVVEGSPAQRAGLGGGDELVAIDDARVTAHNLDARLNRLRPGETAVLHYFRDHQLRQTAVTPGEPLADRCRLELDEDADSTARARRADWLGEGAA